MPWPAGEKSAWLADLLRHAQFTQPRLLFAKWAEMPLREPFFTCLTRAVVYVFHAMM